MAKTTSLCSATRRGESAQSAPASIKDWALLRVRENTVV